MKLTKALETLEKSNTFLDWKKKSDEAYLAHLFGVIESKDTEVKSWQIGYYNPTKDALTVFAVDEADITIEHNETDAFKEENKKIHPITITEHTHDVKEILNICDTLQQEKYPTYEPIKQFLILQKLDENEPQIWNVTYLSKAFNTLNIKIDAETGKVEEHKTLSLIDSFQPGNKDNENTETEN